MIETKFKLRRYSKTPDDNQGGPWSILYAGENIWKIRPADLPGPVKSIRDGFPGWALDDEVLVPGKIKTTSFNQGDREKQLRANEGTQISITKRPG